MPNRRRVLGCGGRTYSDYRAVTQALNLLQPTSLRHGDAKGADTLVGHYGKEHGVPTFAYPPDRRLDGQGRDWKFRRNERMLHTAKPDLVVAFPGGPGTDHMVRTARKHGYAVWDLRSNPRPERLPDWLMDWQKEETQERTEEKAAALTQTQTPAPAPTQPALMQEQVPEREAPKLPATLGKTVISTVKQRELVMEAKGFVDTYDWVINPYQGCSFGCRYCYASNFPQSAQERETWGQWVKVKENAAQMMNRWKPASLNGKTIYMATATDPYQPVERQAGVTRQIVEKLAERHPRTKLVVQTRAELAVRDTDLFRSIEESGGRVQVNVTVTTDDEDVRKLYEPGCSSAAARIRTLQTLESRGVQTCATVTPMLPLHSPEEFAQRLLDAGVRRFIIQNFHSSDQRRGTQVAITDQRAVESAMTHYGTENREEAMRLYQAEYQDNARRFRQAAEAGGAVSFGAGKPGFKPPF